MSDFTFLNFHDELYKLWQIVQNTPLCYEKSLCPTFLPIAFYKYGEYGTDYYEKTLREALNYAKVIYDTLVIYDNPIDRNKITYESALAILGESEEQRMGNAWFQQQYRLIELARYWVVGNGLELFYSRWCTGSGDDYSTALADYWENQQDGGYPEITPCITGRSTSGVITMGAGFCDNRAYLLPYYVDYSIDSQDSIYNSTHHARLIIEYRKVDNDDDYYRYKSPIVGIPDTIFGDALEYETVDFCAVEMTAGSPDGHAYSTYPISLQDVPTTIDRTTANIHDIDVIGDLHPELDETENEETEE